VNLGFGGNCLIEQWAARTIRDLRADRITLELGINVFSSVTERVFLGAVHGFLDTVRDGHPRTPLTVVSPILFPACEEVAGQPVLGGDGVFDVVPWGEGGFDGLSVGRVRELLAGIVDARRAAGDDRLAYLDGRRLLGARDTARLTDGLNPDGDGYVLMGERFAALELGAAAAR
jgi:hypothetical protein